MSTDHTPDDDQARQLAAIFAAPPDAEPDHEPDPSRGNHAPREGRATHPPDADQRAREVLDALFRD